MEQITLHQVEHLLFALAREHLTYNEPIPEFNTRYPGRLESCLAAPFVTFGGKELYPGVIPKISILFYLMVKNHPFENGNKRIAMMTLFYALAKQEKWLNVDVQVLYNAAVWVAGSPPDAKDNMVKYIETFLEKYMVPLTP